VYGSEAGTRARGGQAMGRGEVRLGEFAVKWIFFQKLTKEMDANDAVVEKQDAEEGNSVPKEISCLKRPKSIIFKEKEVEMMTTTTKVRELLQPVRFKPSSVEEISRETTFTKSEVKFLYRSFKQECPNGIIDEDRFKVVYENIFPLGDASKYAHLVFQSIDREDTG
jgi:hypothetical protein